MSKLLKTNDELLTYDMRRTDRIRQRFQQAWDQINADLDRQWIEQLTLRPPKERKEQ